MRADGDAASIKREKARYVGITVRPQALHVFQLLHTFRYIPPPGDVLSPPTFQTALVPGAAVRCLSLERYTAWHLLYSTTISDFYVGGCICRKRISILDRAPSIDMHGGASRVRPRKETAARIHLPICGVPTGANVCGGCALGPIDALRAGLFGNYVPRSGQDARPGSSSDSGWNPVTGSLDKECAAAVLQGCGREYE